MHTYMHKWVSALVSFALAVQTTVSFVNVIITHTIIMHGQLDMLSCITGHWVCLTVRYVRV